MTRSLFLALMIVSSVEAKGQALDSPMDPAKTELVKESIPADDVKDGLPLGEALMQAVETSLPLAQQRSTVGRAVEGIAQAHGSWLPGVTLQAQGTRQVDNPSRQTFTNSSTTYGSLQAQLKQNLFNGLKTLKSNRRAELAFRKEVVTYKKALSDLLNSAVGAFLKVLQAQENLTSAQANLAYNEKYTAFIETRFELGDANIADKSQAQANLAQARADLLTYQAELVNAQATYEQLMQQKPIALQWPIPTAPLPLSQEEVLALARAENFDVLLARIGEEDAELGIDIAKGDLYPTLDLTLTGTRTRQKPSIPTLQNQSSAQIILAFPLDAAGVVQSQVRSARLSAREARLNVQNTDRTLIANVTQAWEGYISAQAQVPAFEAALDSAKIALEGMEIQEELGARTVTDVLNAEKDVYKARIQLVQGKVSLLTAYYALLQVMGLLTPETLTLDVPTFTGEEYLNKMKFISYGTTPLDEAK